MNTETEELRRSAHSVAEMLYEGQVGGECYHGGRHKCFTVQGRKPLALYKVEEMCERCAAAWHAVMTATLLDSLVIGQRFLNGMPGTATPERTKGRSRPIVIETELVQTDGKQSKAKRKKNKTAEAGEAIAPGTYEFTVKPTTGGKYGEYLDEDRMRILAEYGKLKKRTDKATFLTKYRLKAWHLSGWRKGHKASPKATKTKAAKASKTKAAKLKAETKTKGAKAKKPDETAYPCDKCGKVFFQKNWKTMHERFCEGES